ncbi:MAG: response regulator [Deltaproteobacteria bacterium]|nr:response regulator [Deltaproteobacteria bacterium]
MPSNESEHVILMVDDDPDDHFLARDTLESLRLPVCLQEAGDGEELLDYLFQRGRFADRSSSPRPDVILLDLSMPGMDGKEALARIRSMPELSDMPVIIFTTSVDLQDVNECYRLGANSYVTKPASLDDWKSVMNTLYTYWLKTAELPSRSAASPSDDEQTSPAAH